MSESKLVPNGSGPQITASNRGSNLRSGPGEPKRSAGVSTVDLSVAHLSIQLKDDLGRYTSACIKSIVEHLLKALSKTWPYPSAHTDLALPSLFVFTPLSPHAISKIRSLSTSLDLSEDMKAYLEDTFFFNTSLFATQHARLITHDHTVEWDRERQARRFKAEMLLLAGGSNQVVELEDLVPSLPEATTASGSEASSSPPETAKDGHFNLDADTAETVGTSPGSMAGSMPSITDAGSSDDDVETDVATPYMGMSMIVEGTEEGAAGKKIGDGTDETAVMGCIQELNGGGT